MAITTEFLKAQGTGMALFSHANNLVELALVPPWVLCKAQSNRIEEPARLI